jgi:hypothetical protein
MKETPGLIAIIAYHLGSLATLGYLLFFDGTHYTWWNWILIVPLDIFLAEIFPFYWLLRWLHA